jgi:hypothetical protein
MARKKCRVEFFDWVRPLLEKIPGSTPEEYNET